MLEESFETIKPGFFFFFFLFLSTLDLPPGHCPVLYLANFFISKWVSVVFVLVMVVRAGLLFQEFRARRVVRPVLTVSLFVGRRAMVHGLRFPQAKLVSMSDEAAVRL